jgi:glutaconate CoA-transferase subunit B
MAEVRAATGWELATAEPVAVSEPPTAEELGLLRDLVKGEG